MFTSRDYRSDEKFDIAKFLKYDTDVYDVINSPFLTKIKELPVFSYYSVNDGFRDIDLISLEVYKSPFFAFLIQYYNDISDEVLPEGSVLKMFSIDDLNQLYYDLVMNSGE